MSRAYIVPNAILEDMPREEWHATEIPNEPDYQLVVIKWVNPNLEAEFESRSDVIALGAPWEPVNPDAVPFLSQFQAAADPLQTMSVTPTTPTTEVATQAEMVSVALKRIDWPGVRMVR